MGRPLKKSFFGQPEAGQKLLVLDAVWLDDSTGPETGFWIVRQVGTGRFQVTNGAKVGVVRLVGQAPAKAGEATVIVKPFNGSDEFARIIYNRTVTTWERNNYKWSRESAAVEGEADLPLTDSTSVTDEELVEDINQATDGAEVLAVIEAEPARFMDSATLAKFEELVPSSRLAAVGDGVAEWARLYGSFASMDDLKAAVLLHTNTESNKQALIKGADAAKTVAALKASYEATVGYVSANRQSMIADLKASGVAAAEARGAELEAEDFTIVFKQFADMIEAEEVTDEMYEYILEGRNGLSGKKFYGTDRMIPVLQDAFTL